MSERVYLLPVWIRAWHATNAVLVIVLAITGFSLHFADPSLPLVPFALARRAHSIAGALLIGVYIIYITGNGLSGNWFHYIPKPPGVLRRSLHQIYYYCFGILLCEANPHDPTPEHKFNDLQSIIYFVIMYGVMAIVAVTGLIFLYPQAAPDRIAGIDGLLPIAVLHYLTGSIIVLFLILHVYITTMGRTMFSLLYLIVTGWHQTRDPNPDGPRKTKEEGNP